MPVIKRGRGRPRKIRIDETQTSLKGEISQDPGTIHDSLSIDQRKDEYPNEGDTIANDAGQNEHPRTGSESEFLLDAPQPIPYMYNIGWHEDKHAIESEIILPWPKEKVMHPVQMHTNDLSKESNHHDKLGFTLPKQDNAPGDHVRKDWHEIENLFSAIKDEESPGHEVDENVPTSIFSQNYSIQNENRESIAPKRIKLKEEKSSSNKHPKTETPTLNISLSVTQEHLYHGESPSHSSDEVRQTRFGRHVLPPTEYWRNSYRKQDVVETHPIDKTNIIESSAHEGDLISDNISFGVYLILFR